MEDGITCNHFLLLPDPDSLDPLMNCFNMFLKITRLWSLETTDVTRVFSTFMYRHNMSLAMGCLLKLAITEMTGKPQAFMFRFNVKLKSAFCCKLKAEKRFLYIFRGSEEVLFPKSGKFWYCTFGVPCGLTILVQHIEQRNARLCWNWHHKTLKTNLTNVSHHGK